MRAKSVPVDAATLTLFPQARMSDAYRLIVDEASLDAPTAAYRAFGPQFAAVRLDDRLADRQAEAASARLGREQLFEQAGMHRVGQTWAEIADS